MVFGPVERGEIRATLIGDIVLSREVADRDALQRSIGRVVRLANAALEPIQLLEPTSGDEIQGAFADIDSAVRASLLLRLHLLKEHGVESRYGLGCGRIRVYKEYPPPRLQDGPGWWAARTAIERAREREGSPRTRCVRTRFELHDRDEVAPGVDPKVINAYLTCRDGLIGQMGSRQRRLLLGVLAGRSQLDIAAEEGISQSAVSQGLAASGASLVAASDFELAGRNS